MSAVVERGGERTIANGELLYRIGFQQRVAMGAHEAMIRKAIFESIEALAQKVSLSVDCGLRVLVCRAEGPRA